MELLSLISGYFKKDEPEPVIPVEPPKVFYQEPSTPAQPIKIRKAADRSRWTQHQYDFVQWAFHDFRRQNDYAPRGKRKKTTELATYLNRRMGLNKSVSAYARIWRNEVNRHSLEPGETYIIRDERVIL